MAKKKDFKKIGSNILKDVLVDPTDDTQLHKDTNAQGRDNPDVKMHKAGHAQKKKNSKTVRLHVFIRDDIEERLLGEVFKRKRNPNVPHSRSNKRAIIEEALRVYFSEKSIHI